MKLKSIFIICLLLILFPLHNLIAGDVVKQYEDWYCVKSIDKMRDETDFFIYTKSNNILNGWLDKGKLTLAYNDFFYLQANDLGFADDYTGNYKQKVAMKVDDDDKLFNLRGRIMRNNNDIITFITFDEKLVSKMKNGTILHVEVILFQTDGVDQIANFSLNGFTKAYNWVKRKE